MQQKEREIAEGLALSMMAKNWSAPLVGIMGSPLALATIIGIWIAYLSKYLGGTFVEENWDATLEEVMDWLEPQNLIGGGIGAIIGFIFGLPFGGVGAIAGAAIGGTAGSGLVEVGEYIQESMTEEATPEEKAAAQEYILKHRTAVTILATVAAKKFVDEANDLKEWVTGR